MTRETTKPMILVGAIIALILISALIWIVPGSTSKLLYMLIGGLAFFFLPGFLLSYLVFPRVTTNKNWLYLKKRFSLNLFERIILGALFSFSIIAIIFTTLRRLQIILTPEIIGWIMYFTISFFIVLLVRARFYK